MPSTRDSEVTFAIHESSLSKLQQLSLRPGGFRDARQQAWTFLLGVELPTISDLEVTPPYPRQDSDASESRARTFSPEAPSGPDHTLDDDSSNNSSEHMGLASHPDEHQVELDTNRSFILYPIENPPTNKRKSLQEGLQDIILGVLRKRPKLRYFQGYHDIITVLFLTLPPEVVLPSAEKLSLHRVRDSMGIGLDPLVGQLRILKRLLRLIDPAYAEILERNAPLPYYALSNLLTLFSHDVPTLPLIQHVFDWLLCREPIAAIWLAAAVILRRKQDILALEREGDEALGMMHAVLSALPALSEDEPINPDSNLEDNPERTRDIPDEKNQVGFEEQPSDMTDAGEGFTEKFTLTKIPSTGVDTGDEKLHMPSDESYAGIEGDETRDETRSPSSDSLLDSWAADMPRAFSPAVVVSPPGLTSELDSEKVESMPIEHQTSRGVYSDSAFAESVNGRSSEFTPEVEARIREESSSPAPSHSRSHSVPGGYKEKLSAPPLPLSTLLRQASELLITYPPSTPALQLTETFGPQSALYPYSSTSTRPLPDLHDDEADACVGGDNVVLPPTQEELDEESGPPRKSRESDRAPRPIKRKEKEPLKMVKGIVVRRQTMMAGVVLLLGVAVALYGFGPGGRGAMRNGHGYGRFAGDRRIAAWMGALLGVGQRLAVGM